jgi:DNA-binding CsgD family transcriptional regulator
MVDMKTELTIHIWEGCAPPLSDAILLFTQKWQPYSISSRRYPVIRLIEEIIDPALAVYMKFIPARYANFVAGISGGLSFSETIRLVGLDKMVRLQRQLLRQFVKTESTSSARDRQYIATVESLIELTIACACKRAKKSTAALGVNLNDQRKNGFCDLCGNLTEFSTFMKQVKQKKTNNIELEDHKKLELSHQYCAKHKPKLASGEWNPIYRQAKRSQLQFRTELDRLIRQCAKRSKPQPTSGDLLVDSYTFYYLMGTTIQPADLAEIRNHARLITDSKLSDRKKQMLMLQYHGLNQSEIANRLGIGRQAVSKALASIHERFDLQK